MPAEKPGSNAARLWQHERGRGKLLGICLNFFERLDQTIECVHSFLPSNVNIYIFNPGCSRSTREALGHYCDQYGQVSIFDSEVNLGASVGRNYLITHTAEDWLLFVDNDVAVKTSDWFEKFQTHVSAHSDVEAFNPRIFNVHEDSYIAPTSFKIEGNAVIYEPKVVGNTINRFPGCAFFANRKLFDRLGLFDEKIFIGFEDFELCLRGILSGNPVRARLVLDIEFVHDHRRAKSEPDRRAALSRYDYEVLENSYRRVVEKHGVHFPGDWKEWVALQRQQILNEKAGSK